MATSNTSFARMLGAASLITLSWALPAAAQQSADAPSAPGTSATAPAGALAGAPPPPQNAAASPPASAASEVIVTAERRSERLQDVPATISALGGPLIAKTGITSLLGVSAVVPGFFAGGYGEDRPQLFIRGIGTRAYDPGTESSIGIFVDDVYLGNVDSSLDILKDVDRIEVLKGPQGTLYGRNTIGGAINVLTKDPTGTPSGNISVGVSNFGGYDVSAAASGPLGSDQLAGRIVAWRTFNDGYTENLTTGHYNQGIDNEGARGKIRWTPTARLTINLLAEYSHDGGRNFQGETLGNVTNPGALFLAAPGVSYVSTNPFKTYLNQDPPFERDVETGEVKVNYDLRFANLTSITAYRHSQLKESHDLDFTPFDILTQDSSEHNGQFSEELRLTSSPEGSLSMGGRLEWIVGFYYYNNRSSRFDDIITGLDSVVGFATHRSNSNIVMGDYLTNSFAGFGQATYHLPANFEITVGGRYTDDQKDASFVGTTTSPGFPLVVANFNAPNISHSWSAFDPKVVFAYRPSSALNLYASYSQGFKSGGFQFSPFSLSQAQVVFNPEKLTAYEGGAKTRWLDGRLTADVSGFYYDYKDLQISRLVALPPPQAAATLTTNAAASTIAGAEADVAYYITRTLVMDVNYAYTHAEFDNYVFNATTDFSHTIMPRAPRQSLNVSLENRFDLPSGRGLTFRGDYSYFSRIYFEPGQGELQFGNTVPLTQQAPYGLLNGRIIYDDGPWKANIYVNNIANQFYIRAVNTLPNQESIFPGEPRSYGVTVSRNF